MHRRRFLQIAAASSISLGPNLAHAATPIKAIAFDGFVIFDPKSIAVLAESLFPSKGAELINAWRLRQFEYSWLRNSIGRYADFWTVTSEALVFAARLAKLDLSKEKRDQLMNGFLDMKAYPDVQPAIQALSAAGIRLGFLSNLTEAMMEANIKSAGLEGRFELLLSACDLEAWCATSFSTKRRSDCDDGNSRIDVRLGPSGAAAAFRNARRRCAIRCSVAVQP